MCAFIRKWLQCKLFGTHWRVVHDSGLVNDICGAGVCSDCGEVFEEIKWCKMPDVKEIK